MTKNKKEFIRNTAGLIAVSFIFACFGTAIQACGLSVWFGIASIIMGIGSIVYVMVTLSSVSDNHGW